MRKIFKIEEIVGTIGHKNVANNLPMSEYIRHYPGNPIFSPIDTTHAQKKITVVTNYIFDRVRRKFPTVSDLMILG